MTRRHEGRCARVASAQPIDSQNAQTVSQTIAPLNAGDFKGLQSPMVSQRASVGATKKTDNTTQIIFKTNNFQVRRPHAHTILPLPPSLAVTRPKPGRLTNLMDKIQG